MNKDNQEHNKDASANTPLKRRRGRPRKYAQENFNHEEIAVSRDQIFHCRENAQALPGFPGVNGNHSHPADQINDTNDVMVGKVVHGVIEAAFDAGYLLTVKVGNTESTLRGVVFKPGQYIPVSADNDVAPNVQMVRRNEIPFPAGNDSQVHGNNSRSRERNDQFVSSYRNGTAGMSASKGKQATSIAIQTSHQAISKNMYQPGNLSNGKAVVKQLSVVQSEVTHSEASEVKQVREAITPANGSTLSNGGQTVGNQMLPSQTKTSHQGQPSQLPIEVLHEAEAKSMKLPNMPFENLLNEVSKRIQAPSPSAETDTGYKKDDINNLDQALSVEPLQAVQPAVNGHSASLSKSFENFQTGKMTELLLAVQENMLENQALQTEAPGANSNVGFNKLRGLEVEVGNKENDYSNRQTQASSV